MRSYRCPRDQLCSIFSRFDRARVTFLRARVTDQLRYFFIPWEPRIRYFFILRDPVVSRIRYFFIPRDPVVSCVVVCVRHFSYLGGRGRGGGGVYFCISLSLRLPLSLRSRDATISLRLYGAETYPHDLGLKGMNISHTHDQWCGMETNPRTLKRVQAW